jgi:hypothetical protein
MIRRNETCIVDPLSMTGRNVLASHMPPRGMTGLRMTFISDNVYCERLLRSNLGG